MSNAELNEAFRRLARGERFAPRIPTRDEAEAILSDDPPLRRSHGSADGGTRGSVDVRPTNEQLNELFRDLASASEDPGRARAVHDLVRGKNPRPSILWFVLDPVYRHKLRD